MTNRKRVYSVKNHIISNSFVQSVKIIETLLFAQNPQSQVKLRTESPLSMKSIVYQVIIRYNYDDYLSWHLTVYFYEATKSTVLTAFTSRTNCHLLFCDVNLPCGNIGVQKMMVINLSPNEQFI